MADEEIEETKKSSSATFAAMEGFGNLGALKQIILMVGLAASVAIGFGGVLWSMEPDYRPFITDISHLEAGQVADLLQKEKIKFKIDTNSNMLMVEATRIHDARLLLASEGFPSGKTLGYELLDKDQSFGTSQFMEKARYYRSMEGELARTVASMNRVRAARVHLAIPKRSVFVGDNRKPSASVFLELYPGHTLEKMNVAAIVHMVASSVPELKEKDVTVVDQRGQLLSQDDENTDIALAAKNFEYSRNVEQLYMDRINGILEPILGFGNYRVQVSTDIDFSVTEQTAELFNPDLPAMRSEQTLNEFSGTAGAAGIPGALSNQPPGAVSVPEQVGAAGGEAAAADGNVRRQATRNFELDRTISHTKNQVGQLRRLSVAVVVDDKLVFKAADGEGQTASEKEPLSDSEIERLNILVKNAVGYSAARGDSVSIVNQAFAPITIAEQTEIPPVEWYKEQWFLELVKLGGAGFVVIMLILGFMRIMRGLASSVQDDSLMALEGGMGAELGLGGMDEAGELGGDITLTGDSNPLLPGPDASYDQHLDAVKSIVAEDPARVAQVMRTWLANE